MTPEKTSWAGENVGPSVVVVSVGNTSVRVVRAMTTVSAGLVPSTRKIITW